jgi:hypothetical protein
MLIFTGNISPFVVSVDLFVAKNGNERDGGSPSAAREGGQLIRNTYETLSSSQKYIFVKCMLLLPCCQKVRSINDALRVHIFISSYRIGLLDASYVYVEFDVNGSSFIEIYLEIVRCQTGKHANMREFSQFVLIQSLIYLDVCIHMYIYVHICVYT